MATEAMSAGELSAVLRRMGKKVPASAVRDRLEEMSAYLVHLGAGHYRLFHAGLAEYVEGLLGPDERAGLLRALAGPRPASAADVHLRFVAHVTYALRWHETAQEASDSLEASRAARAVTTALCSYDTLSAAVSEGLLHDVLVLLDTATQAIGAALTPQERATLASWRDFVNVRLPSLAVRPELFYQEALNWRDPTVARAAPAKGYSGRPYFERCWALQAAGSDLPDPRRIYPGSQGRADTGSMRSLCAEWAAGVVAVVDGDQSVLAWDLRDGRVRFGRNTGYPTSGALALSEGCGLVAVATNWLRYAKSDYECEGEGVGDEGGIVVLSGVDGSTVWELMPDLPGQVRDLKFVESGHYLVAVSGEPHRDWDWGARGALRVFDAETGRVEGRLDFQAPLEAAAVLPDGRSVVVGGSDVGSDGRELSGSGYLARVRIAGMHIEWASVFPGGAVCALAVLIDGTILSADEEGRIQHRGPDGEALRVIDTGLDGIQKLEVVGREVWIGASGGWEREEVAVLDLDAWSIRRLCAHPAAGPFSVRSDGGEYLMANHAYLGMYLAGSPVRVEQPTTDGVLDQVLGYDADLAHVCLGDVAGEQIAVLSFEDLN